MKNIKLTFLIFLSLLAVSCGFHLRGNQDLSKVLPEVQIQGVSIHSELGRALKNALINASVNVLDETNVLLSITKNRFSKRILSLDSAGRANQYELNYQLSFSLVKKNELENDGDKGKRAIVSLIPLQKISEKREYLFDSNLVLANADEEARLNNDMRQAAIIQLIRRLSFSMKTLFLKSKNKVSK